MLNRVVLVGRLTKDPELKVSQSNVSVVNFTLAVNRPFTNADGERGADFINIVTFRKQAENVNQYLRKGSLAGVDGRLQSRSYENKEGQRVYVTEVVADSVQFLEPKGSRSNQDQSHQDQKSEPARAGYGNPAGNETRGRKPQPDNSQNTNDKDGWRTVNDSGPGNGAASAGSYKNAYNGKPKTEENPFANGEGPVDISDDDLPF